MLNPAWISDYTHLKVSDEITYQLLVYMRNNGICDTAFHDAYTLY